MSEAPTDRLVQDWTLTDAVLPGAYFVNGGFIWKITALKYDGTVEVERLQTIHPTQRKNWMLYLPNQTPPCQDKE